MKTKKKEEYAKVVVLALMAFLISGLYFRHWVLRLGAAAVIWQLVRLIVSVHRGDQKKILLRQEALTWLEDITQGLKGGKSLAGATADLGERLVQQGETGKSRGSPLLKQWRTSRGQLELGYPVALVYQDLAKSLELEELDFLAGILNTALITGMDLAKIFIKTTQSMREQLAAREILNGQLARRKLEGGILAIAPWVYAGFLHLTAGAYMAALFEGKGILVALVVFILQGVGVSWFITGLYQRSDLPEALLLADFQEAIALQLYAGLSLPEAWIQGSRSLPPVEKANIEKKNQFKAKVEAITKGKDKTDANNSQGMAAQLTQVSAGLSLGLSFTQALSILAIEKEKTLFNFQRLLLQNYHLGGDYLAVLLQEQSRDLRQSILVGKSAKDGNQGVWLLFPMMLLLIASLILTAAPAVLSM